jgi:hypothetical protein
MAIFWLFFPPPPIGVRSAPVSVTLLVLADQDAETNAGAPVAFVAQLVKPYDFSLGVALRLSTRRNCRHSTQHRYNAGCRDDHFTFSSNSPLRISPADELLSAR